MSRPDWLRTFMAVYRRGSVTGAAALRGLSQPATSQQLASQQLASLERAMGGALFARLPGAMVPTERGHALYGEVASALDRLETVLAGLDAGKVVDTKAALRIGCSAEYFSAEVIARQASTELSLVARFADDEALLTALERGELDLAVTGLAPGRRALETTVVGERRFLLVAPHSMARPNRFSNLHELGAWLSERPWVAYSHELPLTRRLWHAHLGRSFSARLRLVAADLRAVLAAVERGIGCSVLPSFVCAEALARGSIVELAPVSQLLAPQPWYLSVRQGERDRPGLAQLVAAFLAEVAPNHGGVAHADEDLREARTRRPSGPVRS